MVPWSKDPDLQVQESIALVFRIFLELRRSGKVARHMEEHGLLLPARSVSEHRLRFVAPSGGSIRRILQNPTYTGAYVFGRSRWAMRTDAQRPVYRSQLPRDEVEGRPEAAFLTATSIGIPLSAFSPSYRTTTRLTVDGPACVAREGINLFGWPGTAVTAVGRCLWPMIHRVLPLSLHPRSRRPQAASRVLS